MKEMEYGVLESLVGKIQDKSPDEISVEEHFTGELPDGNEVRKHMTYFTTLGDFKIGLEYKLSFDYYAEEEHTDVALTFYLSGEAVGKIVGKEKPTYWSELLEELVKSIEQKKAPPIVKPKDHYETLVSLAFG